MRRDSPQEPDLDFGLLSRFVFERWRLLAVCGLMGLLAGVAIAVLMQPVYRATTLLSPVTDSQMQPGLGSSLSNLGGLASLAGISVESGEEVDDHIAILRSREFGLEFITRNDLKKVLFSDDWDQKREEWRAGEEPTPWQAWDRFDRDVRRVEVDRATGHVSLSVDWSDPVVAAEWANGIASMVNERIRADAISEAERSLSYLNEQLKKAGVVELEAAIFRLVESQVNRIMLANVRPEFAFRVLDRALPPDPEDFVRPNRPLLLAGGVALGVAIGLLGGMFAIFLRLLRRENARRRPEDPVDE